MPIESLKDRIMQSAQGASLKDPSILDLNPNKQQILSLRRGLKALLEATEADFTAKPQLFFEKPKAAGAIFTESPHGQWNGVIYVTESVYSTQELPKPPRSSNAEFKIGNPVIGLSEQLEKPITINGTRGDVSRYRDRYKINPKNITVQQATETQPSSAQLRQEIIEPASI